jgi:hypothetical protein
VNLLSRSAVSVVGREVPGDFQEDLVLTPWLSLTHSIGGKSNDLYSWLCDIPSMQRVELKPTISGSTYERIF